MADAPLPVSAPGEGSSRWLNSTVLGVALASLCSDVGHEMATSVLPAWLATLGASAASLGFIEGLADATSSFAKLASGLYSDRLARRKPLAVVGYVLTASGMASFGLATRWWHILLGKVLGWVGRGARTPVRNVLMTEATQPATRGRAFGFERSMDSAGAVLGPLAALALVATVGLRKTFFATLIPGVLAAIFISWLVKERPHPIEDKPPLSKSVRQLPSRFRWFLAGVGIAGLGDFSNTLLILWATQGLAAHYGLSRATGLSILLYTGYNVVYMFACSLAGTLADRFPKRSVLALGYALAVVPAAVLLWPAASILKFGVVFGFSGLYMGFWETVESTTAATLLPATVRGAGFGLLATVNAIGDFFSSALVGLLWVFSPVVAMGFVIATSLIGAGVVAKLPGGGENG